MGRPRAAAPRGRVTLEQAAELTGMSRSAVYRRIESGAVPSLLVDGVVTIARRDLRRLKPRETAAAGDGRRAVMLRPDLERYAAWARAAGDRPVSTWLAELADRAAGIA